MNCMNNENYSFVKKQISRKEGDKMKKCTESFPCSPI